MLLNPRKTRAELVTLIADITEKKIRAEGSSIIHDGRVCHRINLRSAITPSMSTLLCGAVGEIIRTNMVVEEGNDPIPMFVTWLSSSTGNGFVAVPSRTSRDFSSFEDKFDWSSVEFMKTHNAGIAYYTMPLCSIWLEYQCTGDIVNDKQEPFPHPSFKIGAEITKEIILLLNERFHDDYVKASSAIEAESAKAMNAITQSPTTGKTHVDVSKLMMLKEEK